MASTARPKPFYLSEHDSPAKRQMLKVALELFVRDGLCETSIRDIANATGYSNPALYKFFASKDALAFELFERCYTWLFKALDAAYDKDAAYQSNVAAFFKTAASLMDESLDAVIYVNENLRTFRSRSKRATKAPSVIALARRIVEDGKRERSVSTAFDTDLVVAMIMGPLGQIARMRYYGDLPGPAASNLAPLAQFFKRGSST